MNTRMTLARKAGEDIVIARTTPQGNQVPSQVQDFANKQDPVNPPAMMDREVRAALFQMAQAITTQAQAITTQDNREVVP